MVQATHILVLSGTWGRGRCSNRLRKLRSSHRHIRRWEVRQNIGDSGVFWYRAGTFIALCFLEHLTDPLSP